MPIPALPLPAQREVPALNRLIYKTALLFAAILMLLGFTGSRAYAQADVKLKSPCGPYSVAFYDYGSLYYQRGDGLYQGVDKDVIDEVARRTGCKFKTFLESRVRTWTHLAQGTLDMTVSGIKTAERERFASFVPYLKSRNLLLVRNDVNPPVESMADFMQNGKLRLAVVKSFQHGAGIDQFADKLRAQGRVDEYGDAQLVARIVSLGRADAFISEPVAWGPLIERNDLERKLVYLESGAHESYIAGLVLSKARVRPGDVQKMKAAIDAMRSDGTLLGIYRKHVSPDVAASVVP
ncbi:MAG: transporter substrate-binding domain-containing protein [Rhodoferax sp.]|nr:transporter substrate-binding domain-containing protein [Rhodoferax sp.]